MAEQPHEPLSAAGEGPTLDALPAEVRALIAVAAEVALAGRRSRLPSPPPVEVPSLALKGEPAEVGEDDDEDPTLR